jgi:tetratricopeptide (TPR) repeat protein
MLILVSGVVKGQNSPQVRFDTANDLLESGEYRKALKEYRAIEKTGSISGSLYLNMGISAVQIDSLGLAKFYFLNAQEFESTVESANKALEFVNSQFSRQSAKLPKLPWDRAIDTFKVTPGTFGLFIIGYSVLCLALILIIAHWFSLFKMPKEKNVIISLLSISVLIITLAFYVDYVDERYDEAVLIIEESSVATEPQENAELVSLAYEGYDLTIDWKKSANVEDWYYIRLGNGQFGWIEAKGIKIL